MEFNLLHLSDLHINGANEPSPDAIVLAHPGAPDAIIITGDIFDHTAFKDTKQMNKNIDKALMFFEELIRAFTDEYKISLSKDDLFFVPGNHEINRDASTRAEQLKYFKLFLSKFYGKGEGVIPDWYSEDMSFFKVFDKNKCKVIITGFCSPHFDKDRGDDFGLIDEKQLLRIRKKLNSIKKRDDYIAIAALHHHFILFEERDKKHVESSVLRNSEQFMSFLNTQGYRTVLHGHKHINANRRLNIEDNIEKAENIITVLGCGSSSENDERNSFNFITFYDPGSKFDLEFSDYVRANAGYNLNKTKVKLPIIKSSTERLKIKNIIEENPNLQKAYDELCNMDTVTYVENALSLMDETLLSLHETSMQIYKNPDALYFILATIHFRFCIKQSRGRVFLKNISEFIKPQLLKYFSGNEADIERLLTMENIYEGINLYERIIYNCDAKQKKLIVLSTITLMLVDFYWIIKFDASSFYSSNIARKIDFSYNGKNISTELKGNTVEFSIDDERRALEIKVACETAEAIKISSLIIKEFEAILHNYERDFSECGFRVYYILPKLIHAGKMTREIESRQFSSYIPQLLPLLAGNNIYDRPEAFAREVVQNAIDAINVRKEKDNNFVDVGKINIGIGYDRDADNGQGLSYFLIEDNGTGMTKYILERYLTTLGLSYYKGADYKALNASYNPISQFGIGFLSCFMLGKHIEVRTMHYQEKRGLYLDIPNFDGCFFIEEDNQKKAVGTTIKIWENPDNKEKGEHFDSKKILDYLEQYIIDIDFDLLNEKKEYIVKHSFSKGILESTQKLGVVFFIDLEKDVPSNKWVAVVGDGTPAAGKYGVYIYKNDSKVYETDYDCILTNNGILIPKLGNDLKTLMDIGLGYFDIYANLPPETMELEVSRDKLKFFTSNISWISIRQELDRRLNLADINLKAPYYILHKQYSKLKYPYSEISLHFERESGCLSIQLNSKKKYSYSDAIISFSKWLLNYSEENETSSSLRINTMYEEDYSPYQYICISLEELCFLNEKRLSFASITDKSEKVVINKVAINMFETQSVQINEDISKARETLRNVYQNYSRTNANKFQIQTLITENQVKLASSKGGDAERDAIRNFGRDSLTGMHSDKRYKTTSTSVNISKSLIKKVLNGEQRKSEQLLEFFISFLVLCETRSVKNGEMHLPELIPILHASFSALMDYASIIYSKNELQSGIKIQVKKISGL